MDTYLINLDDRPDRLAFMHKQLVDLGIPYTRIAAVNGLDDGCIGYPGDHIRLSKPEFACYLSHMACFQAFLATSQSLCLILEDDVMLAQSLPQILDHHAFFDHGASVTKLEARMWPVTFTKRVIYRYGKIAVRKFAKYEGGAGAYVITREFAAYVLAHEKTPHIPLDDMLMAPKPREIHQLYPAVAMQATFLGPDSPLYELDSNIQGTRFIAPQAKPPTGFFPRRAWNFRQNVKRIATRVAHTVKVTPFDDS